MRAIDQTSQKFMAAVRRQLPAAAVWCSRSKTRAGRSHYVFIQLSRGARPLKVRISDHPVGMRRALSGECDLFLSAGAKPASWAVWLGALVRGYTAWQRGDQPLPAAHAPSDILL